MTTIDVKSLTGQLILAIDAKDEPEARHVLAHFDDDPTATFALIMTLVGTTTECMKTIAGERWREALQLALLDGSLDEETTDAPE